MKTLDVRSILPIVAFVSAVLVGASAAYADHHKGRGSDGAPVVYVTSQELYYDSLGLTAVPYDHGPFQELMPTTDGLETEFGPGDQEYVGGRWWVDVDGDGEMDPEGDLYFVCPLFGPGY